MLIQLSDDIRVVAHVGEPATVLTRHYAEQVFEYPLAEGTEPSEIVKSFGPITADSLPIEEIAKNRKAASELVDKVGLNDGPSS